MPACVAVGCRPVPGVCPSPVFSAVTLLLITPMTLKTRIPAITRPRNHHFCLVDSPGERRAGATFASVQARPSQYRCMPVPAGSGYQPGGVGAVNELPPTYSPGRQTG